MTKAPKSLPVLKILMLFRLVFGNYFRLSSNRYINFLVKSYCSTFTILLSVMCGKRLKNDSPYMLSLTEYILNKILNYATSEGYIFKYCNSIKTCDKIMGFKKLPIITIDVFIAIIITVITRTAITIYFGFLFPFDKYQVVLYVGCIVFSNDLNSLTIMNVFGLLNNRMNLLRKSLEAMTVPINIIGKNEVAPKVRLVRNAFRYYSNLLDNLDSVNHCVQYSVSLFIYMKYFFKLIHKYFNIILLNVTWPKINLN